MFTTRTVRWSFMAVFTLSIIVALSACSKKDVVSDEPVITPSGDSAGTAGGMGYPESSSAGDSLPAATELDTAYFSYDSFNLGSAARSALKQNADWMKANPSSSVQIEGHCDERGTTEYNLALGEKRANAVRDYMSRLGIEASRLSVISYGEERPADPGHDEAAFGRNRRASFVLISR